MEYRTFGRLDWRPSALGFGAMRLPRHTTGKKSIDQRAATKMIRYAIDHGVNYLDTAYVYAGSEIAVGRALAGGYRDKVKLATKLPGWLVKAPAGADRILERQLKHLGTDHIDFYLLHALHARPWAHIKETGLLKWAERQMASGRIRHLGFSFHAGFEDFKTIIDGYDNWAFCQLQWNYLDTDCQAGTRGLEYAHAKGLGVIIMEPLRGGILSGAPCAEIEELFKSAPQPAGGPDDSRRARTPTDWALQFIWNRPEVSVVLSGMSTLEQVVENVASAERSGVGSLQPSEVAFIGRLAEAYHRRIAVPCTYCGYCRKCPEGLDLPEVFDIYNKVCMSLPDRTWIERVAKMYPGWPPYLKIERCTGCGACEEACSQRMAVREHVRRVAKDFGVTTAS